MLQAIFVNELSVTSAGLQVKLIHTPFLNATKSQVFTEKNIECRVDVLDHLVADERDRAEPLKYAANSRSREPFVRTT